MVDCAIVVQLGHDAHVEIERSSMRMRTLSHDRIGDWERDYHVAVGVNFDLGFARSGGCCERRRWCWSDL